MTIRTKDTHGVVLDDVEAGQHEHGAQEEQDETTDIGAVDQLHYANGHKDHGPGEEQFVEVEVDETEVLQ